MIKKVKIGYQWDFGKDEKFAERLKNLVLSGKKTATTGLYKQNQKIPKVGEYAAILNTDRKRFCIIQYTNVEIKSFLEVDYNFVQEEGEGDKTVEEWREKHRKFFNLDNDDVKVVCEEFELVSKL